MATDVTPLVSRINVVFLYVRDMQRSLAFYRDQLGIQLTGDDDWQEAKLGGLRFALHHWHEGVGEPSAGTVHINFEVDDADAAADRLRAAGFEARETMRDDWGTAVEVVDPDGYRVYLFQPPR
jgi:catechol 2,3-dioxygenase-like lactoylglutathione lyase family enzyme